MIRPTGRAVMIFAAGIPLALLVVIHDPSLWLLSCNYAIVSLLVIGTDALLVSPPRSLQVGITAPDKLYIGERGVVIAALRAARPAWGTRVEAIAEQHGETEPSPIVAAALPADGSEARLALPLVPRRRGRIDLVRIWLRWRGPLGLVEWIQRYPVDRTVDVVPNVRGIRGSALQFFAQEAIFGIKAQQQSGEGAEFDALRDHIPGLDIRYIDWKHSARHRKLVCKEFKTERNHQIVMAFDTGYLMLDPVDDLTRLDHAINAGLFLSWVSLRSGDLVGTFGFDSAVRQYLAPSRGPSSFARIERATAELAYRNEETNFTLGLAALNARLKRRALVILFTDFVDTITAELLVESMQRLINRHVVIFVTQRGSVLQRAVDAPPRSFQDVAQAVIAHDLLRERSVVFERLERLGVHCLDVPSRGLSIALVNRYLLVKQRGLI